MRPEVKMGLSYVGYTCPTVDKLAKDFLYDLGLNFQQEKLFLEFVEQIKSQATCPLRTGLEMACERIIKLESLVEE